MTSFHVGTIRLSYNAACALNAANAGFTGRLAQWTGAGAYVELADAGLIEYRGSDEIVPTALGRCIAERIARFEYVKDEASA